MNPRQRKTLAPRLIEEMSLGELEMSITRAERARSLSPDDTLRLSEMRAARGRILAERAAFEQEFKRAIKPLRLPPGTEFLNFGSPSATWSRRRGHAGAKSVERVFEAARSAGWQDGQRNTTGSPDGNVVGSNTRFVSPDGRFELTGGKSYGVVAADNYFWLRVGVLSRRTAEAEAAANGN